MILPLTKATTGGCVAAITIQPDPKDAALELLRTAVGSNVADFRLGQWEAIEALLRRERLLVVQRTGWGKSVVYFLASRLLRQRGAGCTLLVSPLLSLMRNQIEAAKRIGVRAETINSENSAEWETIKRDLSQNRVDVLLISPERLANDDFVRRCLLPIAGRAGLLVVDEAHCISDWGHDFRPDYQRIVRLLQALPKNVPVLATTATANRRVVADVEKQMGPNLRTMRGPLARTSLSLQNIMLPAPEARMAWIADQVPNFAGTGIIYVLTKRDARTLAGWLQSRGIDAQPYHSGLKPHERLDMEDALLQNRVKALVATVALGMGFDKPDLGFVIHFQRPASVIHYYQQVGRAGRALEHAHGILLGGEEDDEIADYFIRTAFPTEDEIEEVLWVLRDSDGPVKLGALENRVNLSSGTLRNVLKFLLVESPSPIRKSEAGFVLNPVRWTIPAVRMEQITSLRRIEQKRMQEYMATSECLMQFLVRELDDRSAARCGKCVNCRGQGLPTQPPEELEKAALAFLSGDAFHIVPRQRWPGAPGFEGQRGMIAEELRTSPGRALCHWGDPDLGKLVRTAKWQTGKFSERLVEAAAELIRQQWCPQPPPLWVTCVPSQRHPTLVPDFARRLAEALGISFVECIRQIKETAPQKTQQNTSHQAHNLEHSFEVDRRLTRHEPVLLVDDMVDSRWTMTVLGAKLRQAGSGPVYPFALADSSHEGDN